MKRTLLLTQILLIYTLISSYAQLTPQDAAKGMMRSINIGNSFDSHPGGETSWGNPLITKQLIAALKEAGFTAIRLPVTWNQHVGANLPYTINKVWLDRVDTVVTWCLKEGFFVILNAHHEIWLKNNYTTDTIARFDSIWSQISTRFMNKSDSLLFEMINEPNPLSLSNVNDLNARILSIIRKTNPTRIVLFSGHRWSNSAELLQASVPVDEFLMGYYHSYDPDPFGLNGPGTYGSESDIAQTKTKFDQVAGWSASHNIPVILGEYGYMKDCEYNSRMCAYATVVDQALQHGVPSFAWEDGGNWSIVNRTTYKFNEIKDILIYTYPESPTRMQLNNYADTLFKLQWKNRTTENDSITVERRTTSTGAFSFYKKIGPADSVFIDSNVVRAGTYYYRLTTTVNDTIMQGYPIMLANIPATVQPYSGTAIAIPGTLEVENFDLGIEGESYHDSDPINNGETYRPGVGTDIYKKSSTYYVYDVEPGEWMEYSVNVAAEDDYIVTAYIGAETAGGEFTLTSNGTTSDPFTTIVTDGLTLFKQIKGTIHLQAGEQKIRLNITKTPSFTINKLVFSVATDVDTRIKEQISIFPNPADDFVTIKGINGNATINIYDISGSLVKTTVLNQNEKSISISNFENGIYIIKCTDAKNSFCVRLIKKGK